MRAADHGRVARRAARGAGVPGHAARRATTSRSTSRSPRHRAGSRARRRRRRSSPSSATGARCSRPRARGARHRRPRDRRRRPRRRRARRHAFPVFPPLIALPGATKTPRARSAAARDVGDVDVDAGDWIVADADGVTVVPGDRLDAVLAAGRARAAKESGFFAALRAGRTTVELLGLDPSPITRVGPATPATRGRRRSAACRRRGRSRPRRSRSSPCGCGCGATRSRCAAAAPRAARRAGAGRPRARARTRRCPRRRGARRASASASASSSTTVPRAVFTSTAVGFMSARRRASIRWRVSASARHVQRHDVGACASSSSRSAT